MTTLMPLDTLVRVEAPEGIFLELSPAGLSARLLAFLIDLFLRMALVMVASMALTWAGGMGFGLFLILLFLVEWFYPVVFELGLRGATPGKRALGLKVVMDSGLPVTPAASLVRNLLRTADFLPFLYAGGVLSMLVRPDFKRLGDLAAGTWVIYDRPAHVPRTSALPSAVPLAPARPLTSAQQAVLVALAARAPRLTPERVEELAQLARGGLGVSPGQSATPSLYAVAQWLYGRR